MTHFNYAIDKKLPDVCFRFGIYIVHCSYYGEPNYAC